MQYKILNYSQYLENISNSVGFGRNIMKHRIKQSIEFIADRIDIIACIALVTTFVLFSFIG